MEPRLKPAIQAAGHAGALQDESGELFIKTTNFQEVQFYQEIAQNHPEMLSITSVFMGILNQQQLKSDEDNALVTPDLEQLGISFSHESLQAFTRASNEKVAIVLQNVTKDFREPCVLDVKLGRILWDENAPLEKRARLDDVSKATTSGSLAMRIAGMNVYNHKVGSRQEYDKQYGRKLSKENIVPGIDRFFPDDMEPEKKLVFSQGFKQLLTEIKEILQVKELRMKSASVLLIYEGHDEEFEEKLKRGNDAAENAKVDEGDEKDSEDDDSEDRDEDNDSIGSLFTVKLIDFAHTEFVPGQGPDDNSIEGIHNLISIFSELENRYS